MTVIHKSNVAYAGSSTLKSVSEITKSASDIYNAYAARVVADGGAVADPTACLAAISAALAGDYFYRAAVAVSARWGRKVSGSSIVKLYNLVSTIDGIAAGTVDLDTTTNAWNTALLNVGTDSITFTGVTVNKAGTMGYVQSTWRATDSVGVSFSFTPAAEQWVWRDYASSILINGVTKIAGTPDFSSPDNVAAAILVEQAAGRFTLIQDGLQRKSTTTTLTALPNNATANITMAIQTGAAAVNIAETWYFNNATFDALAACSFDVGARY